MGGEQRQDRGAAAGGVDHEVAADCFPGAGDHAGNDRDLTRLGQDAGDGHASADGHSGLGVYGLADDAFEHGAPGAHHGVARPLAQVEWDGQRAACDQRVQDVGGFLPQDPD